MTIGRRVVDTIMPDVQDCGGPISVAASAQVCAGMRDANYLELQFGEVDQRSDVLIPSERFVCGTIEIPDRAGFGVALNDEVIRAHELPLQLTRAARPPP